MSWTFDQNFCIFYDFLLKGVAVAWRQISLIEALITSMFIVQSASNFTFATKVLPWTDPYDDIQQ